MEETIRKRKVDELGRLVIPIEIRKQLGIRDKDSLCLYVDTDRIILEKGIEIDELGRIVIPYQVRQLLEIREKEELEISVSNGKIILNKVKEKK